MGPLCYGESFLKVLLIVLLYNNLIRVFSLTMFSFLFRDSLFMVISFFFYFDEMTTREIFSHQVYFPCHNVYSCYKTGLILDRAFVFFLFAPMKVGLF